MKLIIVRHAETVWNQQGRLQGRLDAKLTAKGHKQVVALSEAIAEYKFSAVYSSPSGRAIETCQGVAADYDLCELLQEQSFGQYEGMTIAEMEAIDPLLMRIVRGEFADKQLCALSESFEQLQARALRFLDYITSQCSSDETILVVSHGNFIKALLSSMVSNKPDASIPINQLTHVNCAFSEVDIAAHDSRRDCRLVRWGVATHLTGLL